MGRSGVRVEQRGCKLFIKATISPGHGGIKVPRRLAESRDVYRPSLTVRRRRFQLSFPPLSPSAGSPVVVLNVEESSAFPEKLRLFNQQKKKARFLGQIHPNSVPKFDAFSVYLYSEILALAQGGRVVSAWSSSCSTSSCSCPSEGEGGKWTDFRPRERRGGCVARALARSREGGVRSRPRASPPGLLQVSELKSDF